MTKRKILVVDDSEDIIIIIQHYLARQYDVISTTDPLEVLAKVRLGKPDLIVLDISMPGTDGVEVFKQLRGAAPAVSCPIIALTAFAGKDDLARLVETGFDDVVTKPMNQQGLLKAVEQNLARVHTETLPKKRAS